MFIIIIKYYVCFSYDTIITIIIAISQCSEFELILASVQVSLKVSNFWLDFSLSGVTGGVYEIEVNLI